MNCLKSFLLAFCLLYAAVSAKAQENLRTEHDLLGEKQVPAEAYYGVQTARALENFQISGVEINHYPGFVEAWAIVKLAAAKANTDVGAMKPEKLAAIEKACDAVLTGKYHDQFVVDWYQGGAGTSTNMNANEVLANIALELSGHKKGEYQPRKQPTRKQTVHSKCSSLGLGSSSPAWARLAHRTTTDRGPTWYV